MKRDLINRPSVAIILLLIISSYLFIFQLGQIPLTDPDETFYAQTAKEMVKRGEWVTPYLYDRPQFEKPILFYWLVKASFKAFGINEFAARLPSAVFGIIGIVSTYLLGCLLFNRRTAYLSTLILATCVEYLILSRACVTDMVLGTFVILTFLFFLYGHRNSKSIFYILSFISLGFAVLTKGPIGILLPCAVIFVFLLLIKDLKSLMRAPVFRGALLFLAVSVPWYAIMYILHGKDFIDVFFGFHNITRFLQAEHRSGERFYYYIPVLIGGFFPWSVFLPYGFVNAFRKALRREGSAGERSSHIFLLVWFFVFFIFFSISRTKLPTYIFPAFAPLALIVGALWDGFLLKRASSTGKSKGMDLSYYLFFFVTFASAVSLFVFIKMRYPTLLTGSIISAAFLIFGIISSLVSFIKKSYTTSFYLIIFSILIFIFPLNNLVLPEIGRYESSKEMSDKLLALMKEGDKIGAESNYQPGLTFYTGKEVKDVDRHHHLVNLLRSKERVWCVLKEKNHIQLYTLDTKPYFTKPSYMIYKIGKKCIITNKVPEDGKYLMKRER